MNDLFLNGNVFAKTVLKDCLDKFRAKPQSLGKSLKALESLSYIDIRTVPGIDPWRHEELRQKIIQEGGNCPWILIRSPDRAVILDRQRIWNPRCYVELSLLNPSAQVRYFIQWFSAGLDGLSQCRKRSDECSRSAFESGSIFEKTLETSKRKKSGTFFTPEWLARHMVYEVLAPSAAQSSSEILKLRILDPAMGAAHFLLAALDALAWALCCSWSREQQLSSVTGEIWLAAKNAIARQSLYGVELNSATAELARALILEQCGGNSETRGALKEHLKTGHSLLSLPSEGRDKEDYEKAQVDFCLENQLGEAAISFPLSFPELFFEEDGQSLADPGFDFVIGNPPYLSYGLKGVGRLDSKARAVYLGLYPNSAEYKISVYALFVELGHSLLRAEGQLYYVLPDSFLLGRYFSKLRGGLLKRGRCLAGLTMFRESFWQVTVGRPVLLRVSKRERELLTWRFTETLGDLLLGIRSLQHNLETSVYESTPRHRFYLVLSEAEEVFLKELLRSVGHLNDWVRLFSGLIARKGGKKDLIGHSGGSGWRRVLEKGASLSPFSLTPGDTWVRKDKALYRSGYAPEDYENPKMVLNQTGFRLKAAVDLTGIYVFNNHHVGAPRPKDGVSELDILDFVAGVLNSDVGAVIYEFLAMEDGRAMAQVDLDVMRELPMPERLSKAVMVESRIIRNSDTRERSREKLNQAVLKAYGFDSRIFEKVRKRVFGHGGAT